MSIATHALSSVAVRATTTGLAFAFLLPGRAPAESSGRQLTVMSYNIACGRGLENDPALYVGRKYLDRIAALVSELRPDAIGMQEVCRDNEATGGIDQPAFFSQALGMEKDWDTSLPQPGRHQDMVLARGRVLETGKLEFKARAEEGPNRYTQKRGVVWALVDYDGQPVRVLSTHLGFPESARVAQARELRKLMSTFSEPIILTGDFNTTPGTPSYDVLADVLGDSYLMAHNKGDRRTAFSKKTGDGRTIDFIFVSKRHFEVLDSTAMKWPNASDHRPFVAKLRLRKS